MEWGDDGSLGGMLLLVMSVWSGGEQGAAFRLYWKKQILTENCTFDHEYLTFKTDYLL